MPSSNAPTADPRGTYFFGEFAHGLDEKNRVSFPAPWRKHDDGRATHWILVPSPNAPCILGFPPPEFEAELARISSLHRDGGSVLTAADLQTFSRLFNARARRCTLDGNGRLLIPAEILLAAGFGRELTLVGNRRRIEIWAPEDWSRRATADADTYARVASLAGL